jgi:cytosine/adenosine deaminase-related metal-dependent hydrolase
MIYRARWVLPIGRLPLAGGWVDVRDGRITDLGAGDPPGDANDLGDVALLPGLVNAHTHLELSWMAGLVPPSRSMHEWIHTLLRTRRGGAAGGPDAERAAAVDAAAALRDTGTVLVGDVSNTLMTPDVLAAAGLDGVVFHELLGFNTIDPAPIVREAWARARRVSVPPDRDIRVTVVAHAPYSVSPVLFAEIAARADHTPLSVHVAESPEEMEFLRTGRGPIRRTLEELGGWNPLWRAPGVDPVRYLASVGYLQPGVLLVHGVHLSDDSLDRVREARGVIVTCPRSNIWVGSGPPRLSHFYTAGVPVAVGTDSLASTSSLNLFDELREMRRLAPEVSAAQLLESATRRGAEALGFGRDYGSIRPGKRAALITVDLPAGVRDVEEYLVSGVAARAIRRLA